MTSDKPKTPREPVVIVEANGSKFELPHLYDGKIVKIPRPSKVNWETRELTKTSPDNVFKIVKDEEGNFTATKIQ